MNNKTWICDKLVKLVTRYEKRIEEIESNYGGWSDLDVVEHSTLTSVVKELKEMLYE